MIAQARHVHLLVWIGSLCVGVLLFLVAVLGYQAIDRQLPPGTRAVVQIQQVSTSEAAAVTTLEAVAVDAKVNLLRIGANPAGPGAPPWYFAFVGDRALFEATMPNGAYPAFTPTAAPEVFPGATLAERDQPVRGAYAVQGEFGNPLTLRAMLADGGLGAEVTQVRPIDNYAAGLFASFSWLSLVAAVLSLALAIVYWIAFSRKSTALQEFHGYSAWRIVAGQTLGVMTAYGCSMVVVVVVGTVALSLYNGLSQFPSFIWWVVVPMVVVGVASLLVQLFASFAALRLSKHAAVKGARPMLLLGAAAGLTQMLMLGLVYVTVAQAGAGIAKIVSDSRSFADWEGARSSVTVQINPHAFEDPQARQVEPAVMSAYERFRQLFSELDREGSAVLSFHQTNQQTDAPGADLASFGPLGGNSLVVNNNYLDRHAVVGAGGLRYRGMEPAEGRIHLLIPEARRAQSAELVDAWAQSSFVSREPWNTSARTEPYDVAVHYTRDGQEIFNYGDTWRMERWSQHDPVIAVVSPETGYFSGYNLLGAAANSGNVVFSDSARFRALVNEAGLAPRFASISNPATHAAQQLRDRETKLIVAVGNATVGGAVLVAAIAVLAAIYTSAFRRESFVRRTHGWGSVRIHGKVVSAVGMISAVTVAVTGAMLGPAGYMRPWWAVVLAAGLTATFILTFAIAIIFLDRRARAELIKCP